MKIQNLIALSIVLLVALPGNMSEKGHKTHSLPKGLSKGDAKGKVSSIKIVEKGLPDNDAVNVTSQNKSKGLTHGGKTAPPMASKILQQGIDCEELLDDAEILNNHRINERVLVCHSNNGSLDKVFVNLYEVVTLVSPNHPSHYPHNLTCGWQILTRVHNKLYFSCLKVDVADGDYLSVETGGYRRNFSKYSNNMMQYITDKSINLTFVSDAVKASKGFVCLVEAAAPSESDYSLEENFAFEDQIIDDSHEAHEEHAVPSRGATCPPPSSKSEEFQEQSPDCVQGEVNSEQRPKNESEAEWFDKIFGLFQYDESDFSDSFSEHPLESEESHESRSVEHRPNSTSANQRRVAGSIETHSTIIQVLRTVDNSTVRNLTVNTKERNFKKHTKTTELHNPKTGKFDAYKNSTESRKNRDSFSYNETVY